MDIKKIASINNIMLLIIKYFQILPKKNGYGFISESFVLN